MTRPTHPPDVTDAELNVLRALWDAGPQPIRSLTDALYPGGGASHYATVQKLLERLESKGCVARNRAATPHVFAPAVTRDSFLGGQLRAVADRLCGGSLAPLLTHLVQPGQLSDDERKELRRLLTKGGS